MPVATTHNTQSEVRTASASGTRREWTSTTATAVRTPSASPLKAASFDAAASSVKKSVSKRTVIEVVRFIKSCGAGPGGGVMVLAAAAASKSKAPAGLKAGPKLGRRLFGKSKPKAKVKKVRGSKPRGRLAAKPRKGGRLMRPQGKKPKKGGAKKGLGKKQRRSSSQLAIGEKASRRAGAKVTTRRGLQSPEKLATAIRKSGTKVILVEDPANLRIAISAVSLLRQQGHRGTLPTVVVPHGMVVPRELKGQVKRLPANASPTSATAKTVRGTDGIGPVPQELMIYDSLRAPQLAAPLPSNRLKESRLARPMVHTVGHPVSTEMQALIQEAAERQYARRLQRAQGVSTGEPQRIKLSNGKKAPVAQAHTEQHQADSLAEIVRDRVIPEVAREVVPRAIEAGLTNALEEKDGRQQQAQEKERTAQERERLQEERDSLRAERERLREERIRFHEEMALQRELLRQQREEQGDDPLLERLTRMASPGREELWAGRNERPTRAATQLTAAELN